MKLFTKIEWDNLSPKSKGYVLYMQAELSGSELKGVANPYLSRSVEARQFAEGEQMAVLEVQDGEE